MPAASLNTATPSCCTSRIKPIGEPRSPSHRALHWIRHTFDPDLEFAIEARRPEEASPRHGSDRPGLRDALSPARRRTSKVRRAGVAQSMDQGPGLTRPGKARLEKTRSESDEANGDPMGSAWAESQKPRSRLPTGASAMKGRAGRADPSRAKRTGLDSGPFSSHDSTDTETESTTTSGTGG
jgi:hypothetical protein